MDALPYRQRIRGRGSSLQRAPTTVGTSSNFRRALVLWLVTALPWPYVGVSCAVAEPDLLKLSDEYRTDRMAPVAALGLEAARPDPSSARRDADLDDRAILDDDGADEEAAVGDGALLAGAVPTAASFPLSAQVVMQLAAANGGHAKRLRELCRYRC
jgi:hypothetical protein